MSPCLFNFYAELHHEKRWAVRSTSWNQDCQEKYNNLRYADDTTLMAKSKEELTVLVDDSTLGNPRESILNVIKEFK